MKVKALTGKVLVSDLERGMRVIKGIIIPDDNGKSEGIRPRWGKVFAVGEDIDDIKAGQWVLIENGRWTRGLKLKNDDQEEVMVWGVEYPASILLVADELPETEIFSKWV